MSDNFKLSNNPIIKRHFNPLSAQDLAIYQEFLLNDRWGIGCPFIVEWPFLNVLDTINHKIVYQHINSLITKTKKEKA